ncbi:MAG: isochorismatase family protein [Chloroflexi bacterium]|nr:MAG: isochorismatase family protein [Chloroflexota bacterium]
MDQNEKGSANQTIPVTTLIPKRENTLLLVVDVQERLMAAMPEQVAGNVLRNIRILVETAGEFGLPVLATEQYPKGLGLTVAELRAALPGETRPFEKLAFSCCREPAFPLSANLAGSRFSGYSVILCGAETHVCVLQTALDLLAVGLRVFVAADAVCSRVKLNWKLGLDLMHLAVAVIGSTEIFAFGLLGAAVTEQFKRISRLVK